MKVCIDPGHSGPYEAGACAGGVTEATMNIAISKALGGTLMLLGYEVLYTRNGDMKSPSRSIILKWNNRFY